MTYVTNASEVPYISAGQNMVASGNSSSTAFSPSHFVFKKLEPFGMYKRCKQINTNFVKAVFADEYPALV